MGIYLFMSHRKIPTTRMTTMILKIDILINLKFLLNSTFQRSGYARYNVLHNFRFELHHSHIYRKLQTKHLIGYFKGSIMPTLFQKFECVIYVLISP
jgi:hypothetical protein